MKIGIVDADLLDNGTNYPNLAVMKMASYYKNEGNEVDLIVDYNEVDKFDKIMISKVFTKTKVPVDVLKMKNVSVGGTGFFYDKAEPLPCYIEHSSPDYDIYRKYVEGEKLKGNSKKLKYYTDYSIGFTTRGCIRGCEFCVNRNSRESVRHSSLSEFVNANHKKITLWDDNILACKDWKFILGELQETGKKFKFQQGLDFRLLTREKMEVLKDLNYDGDFIFAFDNIKDKTLIIKNLKLWNEIVKKQARFYVFCGFENLEGSKDLEDLFERISILMNYKHIPYIMRHENYTNSKHEKLYINVARWCNQPSFFKSKSFREFAQANQSSIKTVGKLSSCMKALKDIENDFDWISYKYFDMKFNKEETVKEKVKLGSMEVEQLKWII